MDTSHWRGGSKLTLRLALEAGMRVSTKGFKKIDGRFFEHHGLPGYEIEYEFLGEDGQPLRALMRFYFTGDAQYLMFAIGPPAPFVAARAAVVAQLDSFDSTAPWKGSLLTQGSGVGGRRDPGALGLIFILMVIGLRGLAGRARRRTFAPRARAPPRTDCRRATATAPTGRRWVTHLGRGYPPGPPGPPPGYPPGPPPGPPPPAAR